MLSHHDKATISHFNTRPAFDLGGVSLNSGRFDAAEAEISRWEGYQPTPLHTLPGLADTLEIAEILYKDEGPRFGLGSFKALGGAYAVLRAIQRHLAHETGRRVSLDDLRGGNVAELSPDLTIVSATDGNHGRSVAWGAAQADIRCRIYIHAEVSVFREQALLDLGAEVVRVDGDYDAAVAQTRSDAENHGWLIVSDTSWPGYTEPPLDVMAGYGVMAREIVRACSQVPSHVFLQGGVGGLAAAVAAVFRQEWGAKAPRVVVVEPELAPCLFASAQAGRATAVRLEAETIMAGLSCGEPSEIAWSILEQTAEDFLTIPETIVGPTVRLLAEPDNGDAAIEAGESAVAGLAGLICAARHPHLRPAMKLDANSRIVVIGSEGVTDPSVFGRIMAGDL